MNKKAKNYDGWDLALFIYSLAGIMVSLAAALSMAFLGVGAVLSREAANAQTAQSNAVGLLALALVAIPPLVESGRVIFGGERSKPARPSANWYWLGLVFPFGLLLGYLAYEQSVIPGLLGPFGQVLAISTPVGIIVILLRRAGPNLKPRRIWGHFLAGLWAIPFIAIVIEAFMLLFGLLTAVFGLAISPSGRRIIERFRPYLDSPGTDPSQIPPELLLDIILSPLFIVMLFVFLGILVPLIEEILKSSTIWPFLPRKVSSGAAFLGGALGGTGFAFAEAMFLTQPVSGWLITAIARAGASSMHALAAGLTAWGLAEGIVQKRWSRLAIAFIAAIVLHGLWNAAAIGLGIGQLALEQTNEAMPAVEVVVGTSIGIIILLSLVAIALLPTLQARFTDEADQQVSEHT